MSRDDVVFEHISKRFGSSVALDDVSFSIKKGEFFSILGPSGCGKTSLLRMTAGFDTPDSGRILLGGVDITKIPPNKRPVNTVFQHYTLFPHLTIWENIAFGLRIAKQPEKTIKSEVEKMLHLIQMDDKAHKMPDQISGGQKQRVAIARALVNRPKVLLLDEPLAALDLKLRQKMLIELDLIHDEVGITFIFVTHDQTEAMAVSDRIAILNHGRLEQVGTPAEIYETPSNRFVARFIGDTNFLDGTVQESAGKDYSILSFDDFPPVKCWNDKNLAVGDLAHMSVRPEKIKIFSEQPTEWPMHNTFEGTVEEKIYKGDHTHFGVKVGQRIFYVSQQHNRFLLDEKPIGFDDHVWISWHADDGFIFEREKEH